jgi:hypothetical protein
MSWIIVNAVYLTRWAWDYDLNRIEVIGCLIAMIAALAGLRLGVASRWFGVLRRRPILAIMTVGLTALALRAAILPILPIPQPLVTDEFSHLLVADTLAAGRLANPTHPMWRHFETIHVIQSPTYSSMYFPAQGIVLALGKLLMGHPWWGVWLSNGFMCAALCWMLWQWLPPGWAVFGGFLAVLRFSVFSYWNDSYWGGAVPALGGALVLGAIPRIRKRASIGNGLVFGVGAVLLLYSRPYEGFALCAAACFFCRKQAFTRAAAACAVLIGLGAAGLGYYCYRVTGHPLELPYQVNQRAYGWPMTLLWYKPHPIETPHQQLRDYYNWELSEHRHFWPDSTVEKGQFLWGFFIGPCLTLPLFFLRLDRRIRPLLIILACVLAAVLVEQTGYPHYASPATGAILALVVQGIRHMRATKFGMAFAPMIPAVLIGTLALRAAAGPLHLQYTTLAHLLSWCCSEEVAMDRGAVAARLEATPGQHLVIVHYGPQHSWAREWVYNAANIDAAKVVWARDMGPENEELKRYFAGRKVWNVEANQ